MRYARRIGAAIALSFAIVTLSGCPSATFPYYIANLSTETLTELKLPNGQTLEFENVLTTAVPANRMRIIFLDRATFGGSLSEVEYRYGDGTGDSISARLEDGPGAVGFVAEEVDGQRVAHLFTVDDATKEWQEEFPAD